MSERVLCIDDNQEALLWRLRLIDSAKSRLILSTFEWREDVSGVIVMSALYAAAERGVKIRLFIDGIYGYLDLRDSLPFHALLSHPNIQVKFYNALVPSNISKVNYRMHDKYVIADDGAYLLGGRNTYDYFLGEAPGRKNIDRELLVLEDGPRDKNSSLSSLLRYFFSIWDLPCNRKAVCKKSGEDLQSGLNTLKETAESLRTNFPAAYEEADAGRAAVPAEKIRLLANPTNPSRKEPTLWHALCSRMNGRDKVLIQTPYVICGKEMYQDLREAASSTNELTLLINAVENGANPWGCTDYLNQKQNILDTGTSVCEFIGDRSVHTKTVLIDDDISIVGSYNLDMRSTYLDTELMLDVKSPALNEQLRAIANRQMQKCRKVFPNGSYEDGPEYEPRELPREKMRIYSMMRVLTKLQPVRYLL